MKDEITTISDHLKRAEPPVIILGIESSCDETAAAVVSNSTVLSNVIASQQVHQAYGGIVPELASRAHQINIVPVVDYALKQAGVDKKQLHAVAVTGGPGLIGSLMVGVSFAKGFALALNLPLIEVNHMQAHVLAHFAQLPGKVRSMPSFPFLCLTVSGGHTQLIQVESPGKMTLLGQTTDDAAGEAFDKIARLLGFPYPGGAMIDRHAQQGNPHAFSFPVARTPNLDFSFSGLKTAVLYFLEKHTADRPDFIKHHLNDLCASIQHAIITMLMNKIYQAVEQTGIRQVALAGGVSVNSGLRQALMQAASHQGWSVFIPPAELCTDNAAMIAVAGYFKWLHHQFADLSLTPFARFSAF
jgi:N6-L-threonylcarbamoyladenine synthase